jgi:ABC-type uncharacterized transport system permease subunit
MQSGLIAVFYGATAALYGICAWRILASLRSDETQPPAWVSMLLPLAILVHAVLLVQAVFTPESMHFGFAPALSATMLVTVAILWVESFFGRIQGLLALVLPFTAVAAVLPGIFPGSPLGEGTNSPLFRAHLLVAILAYSLLTMAAVQGLLMAAMDRRLHHERIDAPGALRFLDRLPPLLTMERVLFRLISAGFVLLTLTLATGVFFSEEMFGRPLRLDHKTIFAFAAWFVFGGLLAGRAAFGWRGRKALRWTLSGFGLLMLAYVGYRFVFEVVLGRA